MRIHRGSLQMYRLCCKSMSAVGLMTCLTWITVLTTASTENRTQDTDHTGLYCRDSWLHNLSYSHYSQYTCSKCFVQVFMGLKNLTIKLDSEQPFVLHHVTNENLTYLPDTEPTSQVCRQYLTPDECSHWRACCQAAEECCESLATTESPVSDPNCPATWDGVSCWRSSPRDHVTYQSCPTYFMSQEVSWLKPQASRACDVNGSWYTHPEHGVEMSDYDDCFNETLNVHIIEISIYIDMAGRSLSLLFLLTSVLLLLIVTPLRVKLRQNDYLKLHFNLFLAVICLNTFTVIMDTVYLDGLTSTDPIHKRNAVWCRIVHTLAKYFRSVSYMCMFCEGWNLHRQITNVMDVGADHSNTKYYLISWGLPVVTVLSYAICRAFLSNDNCWVDHKLSHLEFIHVTPNLISLLCNLVFLVRIQWVLCTSLHSDPSDRNHSVVRQSLRATVSLVPIFGLHCLFVLYRPAWPPYEIIAALFISTQGIIIAVLYFFHSKDIKHELYYQCKKRCSCPSRSQPSVTSSKSSTVSSRYRSSLEAIYSRLPKRQANTYFKRRQSAPEIKTKSRMLSGIPADSTENASKKQPLLNGFLNNDIHPNAVFKIKHSSWNGLPSGYSVQTPAQYSAAEEAEMTHSKSLTTHSTDQTDILLTQASIESCDHFTTTKLNSLPAALPTIEERRSSTESRPS